MIRKGLLSVAAVLALAVIAQADTVINVGNHLNLLPNTAHQAIQIFGTSAADQTQGMDFNAEILNGNTIVGGIGQGPESTTGPTIGPATITNPDIITGTIFATNNTGANVVFGGDAHLVGLSVTTGTGTVPTNGLLGTIFVDTTGLFGGPTQWILSLNAPDFIPTDFAGSPGVGALTINDGLLQIVPEPSSVVLALFAAAGLGVAAARKRRARNSG